jgi:hypothetical protein
MAVTIGPASQRAPTNPDRFFTPDSLEDQPRTRILRSPFPGLDTEVTLALLWDPLQRWDSDHAFPSARFASPNRDEGMANHRLALFLPSTPDFVQENQERAAQPYALAAGQRLTLDADLVVARGEALTAVRAWLDPAGGLPQPNPWPRPFQGQLDLCRTGFLDTVGDAATGKFRHCIDWQLEHSPGMAALLWLDSHLATNAAGRARSRERVELAARNMLRDGGAPGFQSQAGCHIMQWEFPFYYGHLPETMAAVDEQIRGLIRSQEADGGWRYHPGNAEQADLGRAGDSVLGTCAVRAAALLRHARITGHPDSLAAGERALGFMERFRIPRGGQTWECPMYEPDILAAAYAIRAHHDAWRVTGNPRWLHNAVYWAETGVPFIYLWALPDKPMMLGATIPVFGSTFYTHTWLAVPVQWCGLVYAYHVFHLAEDLRQTRLPKTGCPLPLALNFSADDWRRVVELITVSGMHQQFADGDKVGTYPDSISRFEQKNGAFINPEDILVNVLALQGHDPDVKTARLRRSGLAEVVVSSGATIERLRLDARGLTFDLLSFPGEASHALIAGWKPTRVRVSGAELPKTSAPTRRDPGWWWDERTGRVYLTVLQSRARLTVEATDQGW